MKKVLSGLILLSLLLLPVFVLGGHDEDVKKVVPADLNVLDTLDRIVDWLFTILLIIAALAIVVAAFYFVTAAGDPERTAKARNFVLYALIGVAVAIMARGLVDFVRTKIVGT